MLYTNLKHLESAADHKKAISDAIVVGAAPVGLTAVIYLSRKIENSYTG
jgi:hypothetical protein